MAGRAVMTQADFRRTLWADGLNPGLRKMAEATNTHDCFEAPSEGFFVEPCQESET